MRLGRHHQRAVLTRVLLTMCFRGFVILCSLVLIFYMIIQDMLDTSTGIPPGHGPIHRRQPKKIVIGTTSELIKSHKEWVNTMIEGSYFQNQPWSEEPKPIESTFVPVLSDPREIYCKLKGLGLSKTVDSRTYPFSRIPGVKELMPKSELLGDNHFKKCAVVSNSGTMIGSGLGDFIDSHDAVVRFNGGITKGFEADVGTKTSLKVFNHMVVEFPEKSGFYDEKMFNSPLLLVDSVCETMDHHYSECLVEDKQGSWKILANIDDDQYFDTIKAYLKRRHKKPEEDFHILNFETPRKLWKLLSSISNRTLPDFSPSSGFIGLMYMLTRCEQVNAFEFIPSIRMLNQTQCHYWDDKFTNNMYPDEKHNCTFLDYHPLRTEKKLLLLLNKASDGDVFKTGFVTLDGLSKVEC